MKYKLNAIFPVILSASLSAQSSQLTPVTVYDEGLHANLNSGFNTANTYKPLGLEAVTGLRSDYIYRGRELSDELFEFQLHGIVEYNDTNHLEFGVWHAGALGDGDLSETGVLMEYFSRSGKWTYGVGGKYRQIDRSAYYSGLEINLLSRYDINKDSELSGEISYDTGAEGFYAKLEYNYFMDVSSKSFLALNGGISLSADYYEQFGQDDLDDESNGFNDLFARLTYTYNFTQQVSISSYLGTSILEDTATFYGGVWFETSF